MSDYKTHDDLMAETRQGWKEPIDVERKQRAKQAKKAESKQMVINRLYYNLLGLDDGKKIVADLGRMFAGPAILKKDHDGKIDPHASIASAGAYEVVSYIKQRIENGEKPND